MFIETWFFAPATSCTTKTGRLLALRFLDEFVFTFHWDHRRWDLQGYVVGLKGMWPFF